MPLAIATVTYKSVDDLVLTLLGTDSPSTGADTNRLRLFNRWIRQGWQFHWWPGLCRIEQRYYRDAWSSGSTYASGAEVWYDDTGSGGTTAAYYRANATTSAGQSPVTTPAKWGLISDLDTYIAYAQTGQTVLGQVRAVLRDNVRSTGGRVELPFVLDERGVTVQGPAVPSSVYLDFRLRCPVWGGSTFSGAATYAAGASIYYSSATAGYEGDYYTCVSATSAGQSPETTAAKWSKIEIPAFLADFAAQGIVADLEGADNQTENAKADADIAWDYLLAEQARLEGQSRQFSRARIALAY